MFVDILPPAAYRVMVMLSPAGIFSENVPEVAVLPLTVQEKLQNELLCFEDQVNPMVAALSDALVRVMVFVLVPPFAAGAVAVTVVEPVMLPSVSLMLILPSCTDTLAAHTGNIDAMISKIANKKTRYNLDLDIIAFISLTSNPGDQSTGREFWILGAPS